MNTNRIAKIANIRATAERTLQMERDLLAERPDLHSETIERLRRGVTLDEDVIALTHELDAYEATLA